MATLLRQLRRIRPELDDPEGAIRAGLVLVDGRFVTNPASQVRAGAAITVRARTPLRGSTKLAAALDAFAVDPAGRVVLDAGAAAGGFTTVLLERAAARVYAVDAGHGQLVGSLRQNPRVVNLEATNIADLDRRRVPDQVELLTLDLSYLALADAVVQLTERVDLAPGADLVGLVKPMFELRLPTAPTDRETVDRAVRQAVAGIEAAGWLVVAATESPVEGARGAREAWIHAKWPADHGGNRRDPQATKE